MKIFLATKAYHTLTIFQAILKRLNHNLQDSFKEDLGKAPELPDVIILDVSMIDEFEDVEEFALENNISLLYYIPTGYFLDTSTLKSYNYLTEPIFDREVELCLDVIEGNKKLITKTEFLHRPAMFIVTKKNRIIWHDSFAEKLFNYTSEEFYHYNFLKLVNIDDFFDFQSNLIQNKSGIYCTRGVKKDGKMFSIGIRYSEINYQNQLCTVLLISEKQYLFKKQKNTANQTLMQESLASQSIMVHQTNYEGKIIDVNDLWLEKTGYEKEEVIGKHFNELINQSKDSKTTLDSLSKYSIRTKSGNSIDGYITSIPEKDELGNLIYSHNITNELPDLKHFEDKIQESAKQLEEERKIFESGPLVVIRTQVKKGNPTTYVSPNSKNVLGFESKDFINGDVPYLSRIAFDDWQTVITQLDTAITNKQTNFELKNYRWNHANGTYIWVKHYLSTICDDNGNVVEILHYISNADYENQTQEDLLKHKYAIDQASIVALLDATGRVIYANDKLARIMGVQKEEFINKKSVLFTTQYQTKAQRDKILKTIKAGEVWNGEVKDKAKDGRYIWMKTTIVPFLDINNVPYQYLSIRFDITERKMMEEEIQKHNISLNKTVEERTRELLEEKNITEQINIQLRKKNEDVISSLLYAKRLQKAMMPSKELMNDLLTDYFIYNKPKNIISGDFYWATHKDSKTIIAVADCTGHGISGGYLSIMGLTTLHHLVNEKNIFNPSEILAKAHVIINGFLKQNEETSITHDGMDIALCTIDEKMQVISYSGGMRALIHCGAQGLRSICSDRFSVGGFENNNRVFKQHEISYEKGDMIYMFSDGITDQFNAQSQKRFSSRQLSNLLQSICKEPVEEQKKTIRTILKNWTMDTEQTDDILIVGIRL